MYFNHDYKPFVTDEVTDIQSRELAPGHTANKCQVKIWTHFFSDFKVCAFN